MKEKFLMGVFSLILGKQAEEIVPLINQKQHVNEFLIAKKLGITVNQVRNMLYKASDFGIVSSLRKKDKRKGWYTYFWKIEVLKSLEFLKNHLIKKILELDNQIKSRETKEFYICERCNIELNEETALSYDFTCNECGGVYTLKDKTKVLKDFRKTNLELQKELSDLEEEIKKEKEIVDKKKTKETDKKKKEKKKIMKDKRLERSAIKKKNLKSLEKAKKLKSSKKEKNKKLKKR